MSVFDEAIGLLAPPQCESCGLEGAALCNNCASEIIEYGEHCWRCNSLSPTCRTCPKCRQVGVPHYVWISTYYEKVARDLLSRYKFGHQRAAAAEVAKLMVGAFLKHNGNTSLASINYLVVPVPTATSRMRERGFGHSELLAKKIGLMLKLDRANALRRLGQSRQVGAKRPDRLSQLEGSFAVKSNRQIHGRNVLLVDDVVTTGGTIMAATKALRSAGAKQVDALLFAKRL
jgi:ComF family protein